MKDFFIAKIYLIINILVIIMVIKLNSENILNISLLELSLIIIMTISGFLNIKTIYDNIDPFYTRDDNEKIGGF